MATSNRLTILRRFFHLLSQAQGPHVRPHFFDVGQTIFLSSAFSGVLPAERILAVRWPYGILFFVIENNFINRVVFTFFSAHLRLRLFEISDSIEVRISGIPCVVEADGSSRGQRWGRKSEGLVVAADST